MKQQIERYFANELDVEEQLELLKKVESDAELSAEFARYQNTQALLSFSDTVVDAADSKRGYQLFRLRIKKQKTFRLLRQVAGYAAAAAFLVFFVHFYHVFHYHPDHEETTMTSLFVPAGQRIHFTLQDGTTVWLNTQSRLTYPSVFEGDERRVSVEGEAYFEVAHDMERPFIVTSGGMEMKVLGTTFNVHNYEQEDFSRISLIEGSLQVYDPENIAESVILRPQEEVTIRNNEMIVAPIKDANYFLWRKGIYSFDNEELSHILKKLELYYDIEIIVKDADMLKWKYTVKFRQRDGIDEILRLMQKIHPFKIRKDAENHQIVINK
jgi:ferric-dicitrate binding protein FerR (iron transport regulator)